jgi:nitric oxide reductase NorD protein
MRVLGDALERLGDMVGEPIAVQGTGESPGPSGRLPLAGTEPEVALEAHGGIPHPEWDEWAQAYREDFTRVIEFRGRRGASGTARPAPELEGWFRTPLDRQWRGRLSDGSDVDIDAVVDSLVDSRVGYSACERLYRDRIHTQRDVACAVLIDSSGSLAQAALLAHEIECADALVDAMERTGERHAVFSFWSNGRNQVALNILHDFGETAVRPGSAELKPTHHTRLGAAIRGVIGRLLREQASRWVLLILTDGVPFDDGYEGEYACADVAKAVEEAEHNDVCVAVLCVSDAPTVPLQDRLREQVLRVERLSDLAPALGEVHERLAA